MFGREEEVKRLRREIGECLAEKTEFTRGRRRNATKEMLKLLKDR